MTHKTIINICLTLIALCWTMAIQAQTATVDGINYYLYTDTKTADVTSSTVTGDIVIPEKITVDGVEYSVEGMYRYVFKNCESITSVKMPSVRYLPENTFEECSNLTSVDMPSVTNIGRWAFKNCGSLTSVNMPSVTDISSYAFDGCSSLTSVDMPLVTNISSYAFSGCSNLTSVDMPLVTRIGDYAFGGCPIRKLYLPTTLTSIAEYCFASTREITLAATTPVALATNALWNYVVIRVPESAVNDYRTAAGWSNYKDQIFSMSDTTDYDVTVTAQEKESGLLNVLGQDNLGKVVSLKVTGTINSYDIMAIRNKMPYLHHLDLTDATIVANDFEYYTGYHTEDNIIGNYMFASLVKLLSVKLPKNVTCIRDDALFSCSNLVEVVLPVKLEKIGSSAFSGCSGLTNIDLPPTLKTIGCYAFSNCIYNHRTTKTNQKYPSVNL